MELEDPSSFVNFDGLAWRLTILLGCLAAVFAHNMAINHKTAVERHAMQEAHRNKRGAIVAIALAMVLMATGCAGVAADKAVAFAGTIASLAIAYSCYRDRATSKFFYFAAIWFGLLALTVLVLHEYPELVRPPAA